MNLAVALDLREVGMTDRSYRRWLHLVTELDRLGTAYAFELITDPTQAISTASWSERTRIVSPRRRTRMMHQKKLGRLRGLFWGRSQVTHFPTADVWYTPSTRTVVTLHSLAPLHFPHYFFESIQAENVYRQHLEQIFRVADSVVTVSDGVLNEIREKCHNRPTPPTLTRIYPGIDPVFFPEEWGTEDRARFRWNIGAPHQAPLLYCGGLAGTANLSLLLEAYQIYHEQHPTPRQLVIVGNHHRAYPGSPTLFQRIVAAGLLGVVIPVGAVSDGFLRRLYCAASLFVYPSGKDGFAYAPLEAMACGCPVLCADTPALRETAGKAAVYLPLDYPEAWAQGFSDLVENHALRKELVLAGLEQAQLYRWDTAAREYLDVYRAVAE